MAPESMPVTKVDAKLVTASVTTETSEQLTKRSGPKHVRSDDAANASNSGDLRATTHTRETPSYRFGASAATHPAMRRLRYVADAGSAQAALDIGFIGVGLALAIPSAAAQFGDVPLGISLAIASVLLLVHAIILYASGCYRRDALLNTAIARSRLPVTFGLGAVVCYIALCYIMPAVLADAAFLAAARASGIMIVTGSATVLCGAIFSRFVFHALVRARIFHRRVIVIGTGERALHLHRQIGQGPNGLAHDFHYISAAILGGAHTSGVAMLGERVGDVQMRSIHSLAQELHADEVVVAVDERRGLSMAKLLDCKAQGLPVTDFNAFFERESNRVDLQWLNPSWLVYSEGFQMRAIDAFLKRAMDIVGSLLLLILSSPILAAGMIAVALEGRGGIFYKQTRVTQNGRHFELYKLRTMRSDAESLGPQWAAENDPRVTRVGKFLRRARIDEIPQLINVLRGDMSLVGPRPERPVFVDQLLKEFPLYYLRHKVKAGLTGWAQINFTYGASMADAERKLEYDLFYVKNYSVLRDISIILQTFWVLIWPQGVR